MKNLISTTAIALLLGTSAFAESHSTSDGTMADDTATMETDSTDTTTGAAEVMEESTEMPSDDVNMFEREGYQMAAGYSLTAEILDDANVYDANDEDIGEVSELLIEGNEITSAIVDFGGFLGIGEKPVQIAFEDMTIMQGEDAYDIRIYLDVTREELEAMPEYEYDS